MVDKVIPISDEVYPLDTVINDLIELKDKINHLVTIVVLNDNTAYVAHTGLPIRDLALACKLIDKEFSNCVDLNEELEDE